MSSWQVYGPRLVFCPAAPDDRSAAIYAAPRRAASSFSACYPPSPAGRSRMLIDVTDFEWPGLGVWSTTVPVMVCENAFNRPRFDGNRVKQQGTGTFVPRESFERTDLADQSCVRRGVGVVGWRASWCRFMSIEPSGITVVKVVWFTRVVVPFFR